MPEDSKVALVTGASAGIGHAVADDLAASGWTVVGVSRRGTGGERWSGLVMDVDRDDEVSRGVAEVLERHGRIDALVAAAGWGLAGAVEQTSTDEAKAQVETNFWGVDRAVRAVLPAMRAKGGGRIVVISSIGGVVALPFQAYYSASKFALEGLCEALAYEVAPFGIAVTLVQPGNVATDFTAARRTAAGAADGGDGAYDAAFEKAITTMERDEANGVPSADVAKVVHRVLLARRPPRRLSVGRPTERVGIVAKRLLPFRLFESGAKSSLGV